MRCVCAGQAVFPHGAGQSADPVVRNLRKNDLSGSEQKKIIGLKVGENFQI